MRGEIQKLQGEVQELEGEIEKETGTRDLTKVGEDIAAKKQEILDLEVRIRSRAAEVKLRLDEDIADFEQRSEAESVEEFTERINKHNLKRKDLKNRKDLLDELHGVVDKAYKVFSDSERAPLPESIKDEPALNRANALLGEPGECPVCRGGTARNTLDERRKELRESATDLAKIMRSEEEEIKVIKVDRTELQDRRPSQGTG
jgi:hypothetical protein